MALNLINDNIVGNALKAKWKLTSTSYTANNSLPIDTVNPNFTNVGTWSNSGGVITIPEDGYYLIGIRAHGSTSWSGGTSCILRSLTGLNGTDEFNLEIMLAAQVFIGGHLLLQFTKGDTFDVYVNESKTLVDDTNSFISIARHQDYSAGQPAAFGIANASTYGLVKTWPRVKYGVTSTSTAAAIDFDVESVKYPTIGTWTNDGSGRITIPETGYYLINVRMRATTAWSTATSARISLNTSADSFGISAIFGQPSDIYNAGIIEWYFTAGDQFEIHTETGKTLNGSGVDENTNWMSVRKISD